MSLIVPNHYQHVKIMAIDPGLNNTGIAVFELDYGSRSIVAIEPFTLVVQKLANTTGLDDELYSDRNIKLYKLRDNFRQVLANINPFAIVCESPFFNPLRPMAYASLVEVLAIIQNAIIEHNNNITFNTIAPKSAKKVIGSGMDTGKLDVRAAVMRHNDIMSVLRNDINMLDEHSIDAIAVGYSFLKLTGF